MRNWSVLLGMVAAILLIVSFHCPMSSTAAQPWGAGASAAEAVVAAPVVPAADPTGVRQGLTIRQRRDMGLTVANIRKALIAKQKAGELEGKTTEGLAVEVLNDLMAQNPQAFNDPSIDWDKLLAFLEKLIPLILKLIALFGV